MKEFQEKLRELSTQPYTQLDDIISKMEAMQEKYSEELKEARKGNSTNKVYYLEGLVDGITFMTQPLRKYNDGIKEELNK
ncbi:hypothetical protein BEP19_15660 [Ammoniphilus oxalaticus]|uniref:Uncharacterized protein n=1 Tax=Ammoniphilus oxalaticus TaxID=66863 RepID=A0A419SDB9_9BACL|nr:hypothetical protein [Ammoniphilus oxalaticus]RKD21109.1 hypothetical protein BEP19_15660 [Ammoniphilus oxalaticus]